MINLTASLNSVSVAVNPNTVTHVHEAHKGCVIYFIGDKTIHVANEYKEVIKLISDALSK